MKKRLTALLLILITVFSLFTACVEDQLQDLTVTKGSTIRWVREEGCYFSSSDTTIATIDQDGVIFGVSVGTCTMTAETDTKNYSVTVHVVDNEKSSLSSSFQELSSSSISESIGESSSCLVSGTISGEEESSSQETQISSSQTVSENLSSEEVSTSSREQSDISSIETATTADISYISSTEISNAIHSTNPNSIVSSSQSSSISETSYSSLSSSSSFVESSSIISSSQVMVISSLSSAISSSTEEMCLLDTNGGILDGYSKQGQYYICEQDTLPTPTKTGYNFKGWYLDQTLVSGAQVGKILVAEWEEITFEITYELNGGENNSQNPKSYGFFDEDLPLYEPTKANEVFIGWFLDSEFIQQVTVVPNTKENLTLYAKFADAYTLEANYNGSVYTFKTEQGEKFSRPEILVEDGYFIEWFIDQEFTTSYNFNQKSTSDIVLYGKKYQELTSSFFGYENNAITEINSLEEFQYYLEYTFFNEIDLSTDNYVKVNIDISEYLNDATKMSELVNKTTCPFIQLTRSTKTVNGELYFQARVATPVPQTFYTQEGKGTLTQLNYAGYGEDCAFQSERSETFDDFAYKALEEEVSVTNSNQLFFALEHRVEPIAVAGSNAEIALNKCKAILRQICDDSMSDKEKVIAIYKYIIMNTEYVMPSETTAPTALMYDAFYMEGVLNNGAAVCDGMAKTMSALCNIEGIRCVRTASSSHAWNEVFVDGQWLVIDATHGNIEVDTSEVISFGNCFINEQTKETMKYADTLRTEVVADGVLNIYEEMTFEYNNYSYDYLISSQSEMTALFSYCLEQATSYSYSTFTVEIMIDFSSVYLSQALSTASTSSGLSNKYQFVTYSLSSSMAGRQIYLLIFNLGEG